MLLPVRTILVGIRLLEEHVAGRSFDLSRSHGWIGIAAAVVGAVLALGAFVATRAAARAVRAVRGRTG